MAASYGCWSARLSMRARMLTPNADRMAAGVLSADELSRYGWTDDKPDPATYTVMLLRAVAERPQW